MNNISEKPSIAIFFPVYRDEGTVETVAMKSLKVLSDVAARYKVIIVDDASPDRSGAIADELAKKYPDIISVHHEKNLGYGAALQTGFKYSLEYEWICFTDGDNQYDVNELYHLSKLFHHYDLIVTFRYSKIYGTLRTFISFVYNCIIRTLFKSHLRDHNCGLKVIRSSVVKDMKLISNSAFIGAEIIINAMVRGYPIGEAGIQTYPRTFGESSVMSRRHITNSIKDMFRVYKKIFKQTGPGA
ncbi:MAG: glycosyltransferase family 2 protein [Nitrospirae bacterium]|nr:glycosyltransferase family 2 protein [Nitrospirota bacterium]